MKDNLKKDTDKVFLYNDERLKTINIDVRMESEKIKKSICESEAALQRLGYLEMSIKVQSKFTPNF